MDNIDKIKSALKENKSLKKFKIRKAMGDNYLKIVNEGYYNKLRKKKLNENDVASYLPLLQVRLKGNNIQIELMLDNKCCRNKIKHKDLNRFKERFINVLDSNEFSKKKIILDYQFKNNSKGVPPISLNHKILDHINSKINNILWIRIFYIIKRKNKNLNQLINDRLNYFVDNIYYKLFDNKHNSIPNEVNQDQRAALAWNVLIKTAKEQKTIRYGNLSSQIGMKHHRPLRYVLGIIQNYCLENKLPPLTILVVNNTGLPGNGFIAWDINNSKEGLKKVFNFNWENLENPFGYAENGITEDEIINNLLNRPNSSKEMYAKVKVRGVVQNIFRKTLLKVYNSKCAICGIDIILLLEACHIIPWSKCNDKEKLDIRNGILLCPNHHKLLDSGYIIIKNDYSVRFTKELSKIDPIMSKKMLLPSNKEWWPSIDYLKRKSKYLNININ